MVHLGFEVDLTFILDKLPSETMEGEEQGEAMEVDGETMVKKGRTRVTTLFSATMPAAVERLARKYLKRPAIINIGEAGRAVDTVEQRVEFVIGDEKKKCVLDSMSVCLMLIACFRQRLLEILNSGGFQSPIIVFVNQKKTADMVAKDLSRAGVRALFSLSKTIISDIAAVECLDSALWEEPRTTRGLVAISAHRRGRYPGGHRSRRPRYRRARRLARYQLPDGEHDRGICPPYRYARALSVS